PTRPPTSPPFPYTTLFRSIVGMLFAYDPALERPGAPPDFALWAHGQKPGPGGWSMKILWIVRNVHAGGSIVVRGQQLDGRKTFRDRKSTRLNSSHVSISYA